MTIIALRDWDTEKIVCVNSWKEADALLATGHYTLVSGLPH